MGPAEWRKARDSMLYREAAWEGLRVGWESGVSDVEAGEKRSSRVGKIQTPASSI
jgi:hypothetical protein